MGYNLKATYSDLAELEGASGIGTVAAIFGKDILEGQKTKEGKFVDLNLVSFSEVREGLTKGFKAPLMEPYSAGSSKRARAPSSVGQIVSCLVDGCKSDLSKCRDYHRRHKVCEMHSKTPKVTIGGHEQRFCQQCSRFHSLGEFDEGKRSCRKRLEGHNRRRRKPPPEPLPHANFLSSASQGGRYLAFGNQTMIPDSSVVSTTWPGAVKAESENNPSPFSSSVSASYSQPFRGRQFPFLQAMDSSSSSGQQVLHHHPNNGLNQVMESDHRALSLLSSSPAEMGLGRFIEPNPINHPARPSISSLLYNNLGQFPGMEGQAGGSGSAFLSNMRSSNTNNLCQDVFQTGTDGSSATASSASGAHHQTLSFSWE